MPPKKDQALVGDEFDSSELDELSENDSNFDENIAVEYRPRNKLEEPRNKTLSVEILYGTSRPYSPSLRIGMLKQTRASDAALWRY
jgi:hypothetical protein